MSSFAERQASALGYLAQERFLDPPLHQPGKVGVVLHVQMRGDDRGAEWGASKCPKRSKGTIFKTKS